MGAVGISTLQVNSAQATARAESTELFNSAQATARAESTELFNSAQATARAESTELCEKVSHITSLLLGVTPSVSCST